MAKKKADNLIITRVEEIELNFYAVRSKDGKWLRAKGYNGGGESWVEDITKAKLYGNAKAPKTQISFWASNYPQFGIPDLVRITVGKCEYIDQTDRVSEFKLKKAVKEAQRELDWCSRRDFEHNRKVMALNGDGNDHVSIENRKNFSKAQANLLKAIEELENYKASK